MKKTFTDEYFMRIALDLAAKAKGLASPNPMVGVVIVNANKVIAKGYHRMWGTAHAEVVALKKLKMVPKTATMYVNLEPCNSVGKTPPCVDAVIKSGMKRVVIAMKDPNPSTNGKSISKMRRQGILVKVGVLEPEARMLNEAFIKRMVTGMPFVVAKTAQTVDGKVATRKGDSKWITSDKTRKLARKTRDEFDAILVGVDTVIKDNPSLAGVSSSKRLKKIIVDSKLRISKNAKLFNGIAPSDCIVATTKQATRASRINLERKGISIIICPSKDGKVDLKWLFKKLVKSSIISILIEGGPNVIGCALKNKLVDKMHIYIAPKILGDQDARSSVVGMNILKINKTVCLKDISIEAIGKDILVKAYVLRNS